MTAQPSIFRLARRSFWLLFGGIWLLVGVIFLAFAIAFAVAEIEYANGGVTTTGMVLTRDIVPARSSSSTQYRVSYRFTTVGGDVIEGSDGVDVSTWERLQERGPIAVHYVSGRPSSNRLAPGTGLAAPLLFLLVGLTLTGAGGILVVRALRHIFEARRLLRLGHAAAATVIAVDATNITVNGRQQFKVRYTYLDQESRSLEGDSGYLSRDEAARWNPGDRVSIRYDPNRPQESVWIGESEATPRPTTPVDALPPGPVVTATKVRPRHPRD